MKEDEKDASGSDSSSGVHPSSLLADCSLSASQARTPRPAGERNALRRFLKALGPGLITGASDDDPSGIATYAMAGAALGYATLWMALLTFPLMAAVQFVCAKVGMVTGKGLAGVLRQHYPRLLLYPAVAGVLLANTINAGADLGAIAAGVNLLLPIPVSVLIAPVALLIVVLQVWGSYRFIASSFKWLTLSLLAYIGAAVLAKPELGSVLKGTFLPTLRVDSASLAMLVAVLGTTISPYLFFWQANQEVEEKTARRDHHMGRRRGATAGELRHAAWDVGLGMFFSNVVMYFIILATAATLHRAGRTDIQSAAEAAEALRPLAGNAATVLMALGLIGTGVLAVPILTASGAYAVCEAFGWKCSLDAKPGRAKEFYIIITASTLVGLLINFLSINPVTALFWTAVINGFLAPPLLVIIMLIANNRAIMGNRANGRPINLLGWATTLAMFAAAVGLICTWGQG
jgi:NRAMP (natural resistance-associated macrophage protein)-like metal ion transporter